MVWPDGQTDRRFAECTVQDVDRYDLVLGVVVVDVVVLLVVVSVPTTQDETCRADEKRLSGKAHMRW